MEFKEFVKARNRMCKEMTCFECPLAHELDAVGKCSYTCFTNPEEAEKIVSDWSKEHPHITNERKLKEVLQDTFGEDYKKHILMNYSLRWADEEYKKPQEG